MKQILALVCIATLFSACTRPAGISPRLNPVYVKLSELSDCNITYSIDKNETVTLALDDAKCITSKLDTCLKEREQLRVANVALNAQIFLANQLGGK